MVEVVVVCEGQTEETFVRSVLAEPLSLNGIYMSARVIPTSPGHRGGALNRERVTRFVRNTLLERANTYVSTFFDLYGLDKSFAKVKETRGREPSERATEIERALHQHVVSDADCRAERFLPHIQPHEFEALLFSDVDLLCSGESEWREYHQQLAGILARVPNPEWINDAPQTAPSKRLEMLSPRYRKRQHGPDIAQRIGLDTIRNACPHFNQWYDRLLDLTEL